MTEERNTIIKEVLQRMDEISPAEDINIVEGQLVDTLLDGAMSNYLLSCDIHKIPCLRRLSYPSGEGSGEVAVEDGVVSVPADYIRLAWVRCPQWARDLNEGDLMESGSMAWKMQSLSKFLRPTPLKPSVTLLPQGVDGRPRLKVAPFAGEVTLVYVARQSPEAVRAGAGQESGFWQAFLWYAAYVVLSAMGEPETASMALQHMQQYQLIPSGMPLPVREDRKN